MARTYRGLLVFGLLVAVTVLSAHAQEAEAKDDAWTEPFEYEYADGLKLRLGMDFRVRFTSFDRNVIWPDDGAPPNGQPLQYIRWRTRVWGSLDLTPNMTLNARLVNRWHHFSSHFFADNNDGKATWEFPDEVIFDDLNLDIRNVFDTPVSIKLGRQALILGNGMVFLEGTPYDQGRTIYFDGASARFVTESDHLTLFVFYNEHKDEFLVINDKNRRLRRGDTFTTGAYWTHTFDPALKTDLYYNYTVIDDSDWRPTDSGERAHPLDENAIINSYGARVFGTPHKQVDYSAEIAFQCGENFRETRPESDMTGMMADLRLMLRAPEDVITKPSLLLEYTYLSGDDPGSVDEYEGWHPLFAEYPIWREELLPIMLNGHWTNLHQWRAEGKFALTKKLRFTASYAYLEADEGSLGPSGDDGFGQLVAAFLDYAYNKNLSFALESAFFFPGDYWVDGHNARWFRFQTMLRF